MTFTLLLTLCNIILLCLMILAATVFMPYRGLAKNFPEDVQEVLKPRLDQIDRLPKTPRIFGSILIIIMCLLFIGVFIMGGIDGIRNDYTYDQFLLRFLIIAFGTNYLLLTKTNFFPHFFPETKGCAGWQKFGYNRKQHLKQSIIMLICCLVMAFVFIKI